MCLGAAKPAVGHGRMRGHGEGDYGAPGVGELNKSWTSVNVCKVRRRYRLSHFKHSSEIYTNITNESLHVELPPALIHLVWQHPRGLAVIVELIAWVWQSRGLITVEEQVGHHLKKHSVGYI